jgi:hypothetical protein
MLSSSGIRRKRMSYVALKPSYYVRLFAVIARSNWNVDLFKIVHLSASKRHG